MRYDESSTIDFVSDYHISEILVWIITSTLFALDDLAGSTDYKHAHSTSPTMLRCAVHDDQDATLHTYSRIMGGLNIFMLRMERHDFTECFFAQDTREGTLKLSRAAGVRKRFCCLLFPWCFLVQVELSEGDTRSVGNNQDVSDTRSSAFRNFLLFPSTVDRTC